jgi:hypothetical protein
MLIPLVTLRAIAAGEVTLAFRRWDRARVREGTRLRTALELIAQRPAVRAPDLAASLGWETVVFKRYVRKLKELGLTESLDVGYRLSPRGAAVLSMARQANDQTKGRENG